jgi:hypothetical protein
MSICALSFPIPTAVPWWCRRGSGDDKITITIAETVEASADTLAARSSRDSPDAGVACG